MYTRMPTRTGRPQPSAPTHFLGPSSFGFFRRALASVRFLFFLGGTTLPDADCRQNPSSIRLQPHTG